MPAAKFFNHDQIPSTVRPLTSGSCMRLRCFSDHTLYSHRTRAPPRRFIKFFYTRHVHSREKSIFFTILGAMLRKRIPLPQLISESPCNEAACIHYSKDQSRLPNLATPLTHPRGHSSFLVFLYCRISREASLPNYAKLLVYSSTHKRNGLILHHFYFDAEMIALCLDGKATLISLTIIPVNTLEAGSQTTALARFYSRVFSSANFVSQIFVYVKYLIFNNLFFAGIQMKNRRPAHAFLLMPYTVHLLNHSFIFFFK